VLKDEDGKKNEIDKINSSISAVYICYSKHQAVYIPRNKTQTRSTRVIMQKLLIKQITNVTFFPSHFFCSFHSTNFLFLRLEDTSLYISQFSQFLRFQLFAKSPMLDSDIHDLSDDADYAASQQQVRD
jgi:hypothetical protein